MADSVDRVFGYALNTVNKIRPGSQKPPLADRQELYGLYKQSMEGNVSDVADRPRAAGTAGSASSEQLKKEQEKWDAWKSNEGLTRTEAKRQYIEKVIDTMHKYASFTPEARVLVQDLEFIWDQIKNNSQPSGSEHSSPLQQERSAYLAGSSAAGLDASGSGPGAGQTRGAGEALMRVLSPVSQAEEEELLAEEQEEFVDAPISQVDVEDIGQMSEAESGVAASSSRGTGAASRIDTKWRRRIESGLMKLTLEVSALREQLESKHYWKQRNRHSLLGWIARLSWWAVQLVVADAVILWIVILYMRRRQDRRLEMAVRVLLGDAVAQVQRVGNQVKMPTMPKIPGRKQT